MQVFWWLVEGKFGDREEALTYQLVDFIRAADATCRGEDFQNDEEGYCTRIDWYMDAPGWSLACGITSVSHELCRPIMSELSEAIVRD